MEQLDKVFVVDRAYEVMTGEQLSNCIHGAAHELFRRTDGDKSGALVAFLREGKQVAYEKWQQAETKANKLQQELAELRKNGDKKENSETKGAVMNTEAELTTLRDEYDKWAESPETRGLSGCLPSVIGWSAYQAGFELGKNHVSPTGAAQVAHLKRQQHRIMGPNGSGMSAAELRDRVLNLIRDYLAQPKVQADEISVLTLNALAGDIQVIRLDKE